MARASKRSSGLPPEKEVRVTYPSQYGSHASMIAEEAVDGYVTLQDEFGFYKTEVWRLDNGLADPNRYKISRLKKLFVGKEKSEKKKR